MFINIPDICFEFNPQLTSMLSLAQDNGFGEIYKASIQVSEQVCAFTETPLNYHGAMIYLEH
jgi:hypothetical protein